MQKFLYNQNTYYYNGQLSVPSTYKSLTMAQGAYANITTLISGNSYNTGDVFYVVNGADTTDYSLRTARTSFLGILENRPNGLVMQWDAYMVTSSSTIKYIVEDAYYSKIIPMINAILTASQTAATSIGAQANVAGSGILLNANLTNVAGVYGDDGGVAVATGNSLRVAEFRALLSGVNGSSNVSMGGLEGHAKLASNFGSIGHKYGVWGYFEPVNAAASVVPNLSYGVFAMLDVPSAAAVAAGAVASAIGIASQDLSGGRNSSGLATCINVENPLAGTWDALASFGSATGATGTTYGSINANLCLKVYVGGTLYKIPLYAAS